MCIGHRRRVVVAAAVVLARGIRGGATRRVFRRMLLSALVVVGCGALSPAAHSAGLLAITVQRPAIRAVTWNICGWKIQDACRYPSIGAKATEIKNLVGLRDANMVFLQEACQAHLAQLADLLGPEWTVHATPYMRWIDASSSRPIWCGNDHPGSADALAYGSVNVAVAVKEAAVPASAKLWSTCRTSSPAFRSSASI